MARLLREAGAAQASANGAAGEQADAGREPLTANTALLARIEKTLDLAKMEKEKGHAEYKKLSYATAAEAYSKAIRLTKMLTPPLPKEQQTATRALKLACLVQRRPSCCARVRRKSTPP